MAMQLPTPDRLAVYMSAWFFGTVALASSALAAPELFWTEMRNDASGAIRRSSLDGGSVATVVPSGLVGAFRMTVDEQAGKLYWSSVNGQGIRRANLDGTQMEIFFADSDPILGLAHDPVNERILFYKDQDIRWAKTDGSNVETLLEDFGAVENITVDAAAGKLYMGQRGFTGNGLIWRCNLDGSGLEQIVSGISNGPIGLGVDAAAGRVFWAQGGAGQRGIRSTDLSAGDRQTLVDDVDADALIVDPASQQVLWTSNSGGVDWIERAAYDGSDRTAIHTNIGAGGIVLVPEPAAAAVALTVLITLAIRRPTR
jgi:hypothetical protein